jgi:hypothetical protein
MGKNKMIIAFSLLSSIAVIGLATWAVMTNFMIYLAIGVLGFVYWTLLSNSFDLKKLKERLIKCTLWPIYIVYGIFFSLWVISK